MMKKIGDEINAASGGALNLPRSNARVLDLCMAPGGYTASTLKHSPYAVVCGFTLPLNLGGHAVLLRKGTLYILHGDITMLHKEFGVEEIPPNHCELSKFSDIRPWFGKRFDLVFCDGQTLRTHEPYIADYRRQTSWMEAARLTVSQLILAMQRIESGGTLIMLLHNVAAYRTVKLLHFFDQFAAIQAFKPLFSHKKRGTFYLIAKNVQPGHPGAVAAINEWKGLWKEFTFPALDEDGKAKSPEAASVSECEKEVLDLLETFGERLIELGEPIWEIQKEALATARWTKKPTQQPGTEDARVGEASSTATTDNAAVTVRDSEEDPDGADTATLLGEASKSTVNDPANHDEVVVAMGTMGIAT